MELFNTDLLAVKFISLSTNISNCIFLASSLGLLPILLHQKQNKNEAHNRTFLPDTLNLRLLCGEKKII